MPLEDVAQPFDVEIGVRCFHGEKEAILRSAVEVGNVEDRVIKSRQSTEQQKGEQRRGYREQHRDFKGGNNESGPAIERTAADIDGIAEDGGPILQEIAVACAHDPAEEDEQRDP